MNFATLKGLTIPEGKVTQITDASGRALWSAAPSVVTIYVVGYGGEDYGDYDQYANSYIMHNGVKYTYPATFEANVGDVIECYAEAEDTCDIYVNDVRVSGSETTYIYTVTSNTRIELYSDGYDMEAYVKITELPPDSFLFYTASYNYAAKEGMTWAEWCNSEYNSINYYSRIVIEDGYVKQYAGYTYALALNDVIVKPTDIIVNGAKYANKGYPVTVTILSENKDYAPIEINGQVYSGNHVLELLTGTKITCKVQEWSGTGIITKNGTTVASISNHTGTYKSYTYYATRPVTIHGYYDYNNVGGRIDITEQ